jgi:hypothetical protein
MSHHEQRRHYRIPCHIPAQLQFASGPYATGVLRDMTIYGACVQSQDVQPQRGRQVNLSFIANGVHVRVEAVVTWAEGADTFGVRFTEVPPQDLLHIAAYLYSRMQMLGFRPSRW